VAESHLLVRDALDVAGRRVQEVLGEASRAWAAAISSPISGTSRSLGRRRAIPVPVRWATVHADGTFTTVYPAKRYMPDGTDCAESEEAECFGCVMTVAVLDRLGRRDDSFGVSGRGQPAANLSFSSVTFSSTSR